MKMPALFSFLGGMASGYNAKKAAEADLAAQQELEATKASGRMDLANVDNAANREARIATSQIDAREKEIFRLVSEGVLPSDQIIKEYQRQILEIKGGGSVSGLVQEAAVQETDPATGTVNPADRNREVSQPARIRRRPVVTSSS
jgi:prophage DNA circulation protein